MKIKLKTIEQIKKEFKTKEYKGGFRVYSNKDGFRFINKKMFKYFGKEIEVEEYKQKFSDYDFFKKDSNESWTWKFSKDWVCNDFIEEDEFSI